MKRLTGPGNPRGTVSAGTPIDLGLALSVYGKSPEGRRVTVGDIPTPQEILAAGTWPTEQ